MYSTEWRILDVWRCFRWRRCCCWYRRYSCCSTFPATPFVSTSSSSRPSTHRTCPIVFSSSFRKSSSSCSTSTLPQTSSCTALRGRRSGAPPTGWCGARHGARRCGLDACGDVGGRRRSLSPRTSLSSRRRLNPLSPVPVNCSEAYRSNHRTTNSVYTGRAGLRGGGRVGRTPTPSPSQIKTRERSGLTLFYLQRDTPEVIDIFAHRSSCQIRQNELQTLEFVLQYVNLTTTRQWCTSTVINYCQSNYCWAAHRRWINENFKIHQCPNSCGCSCTIHGQSEPGILKHDIHKFYGNFNNFVYGRSYRNGKDYSYLTKSYSTNCHHRFCAMFVWLIFFTIRQQWAALCCVIT